MKRYRFDIPYTNSVDVFAQYADEPYALFLDSSDRSHKDSQFSFIAHTPIETVQCTYQDNPFDALNTLYKKYAFGTHAPDPDFPFTGGIAGAFGYDLGRSIENLPLRRDKKPFKYDMMVGVYTHVIAFDHINETACYFIWAEDGTKQPILSETPHKDTQTTPISMALQDTDTEQTIETIIDYIKAGDIFQANIAKSWKGKTPKEFHAYTHYKTLRRASPAPFGAYLNFGDVKIASVSPERFLQLSSYGTVTTKPIKGTLPANQDAKILINSEKDRAENIMIVDLLRNDLSKTCAPDSINVTDLCKLETFKSVHHLVSTVQGQLQTDKTPIDLMKSCFPGGSITGAPKIRAMEIIDELEDFTRGFYCGSLGYIGFDGAMDTNIIIRTLIHDGDIVTLHTGSGITAQSDPIQENVEMNDKAHAILESLS